MSELPHLLGHEQEEDPFQWLTLSLTIKINDQAYFKVYFKNIFCLVSAHRPVQRRKCRGHNVYLAI